MSLTTLRKDHREAAWGYALLVSVGAGEPLRRVVRLYEDHPIWSLILERQKFGEKAASIFLDGDAPEATAAWDDAVAHDAWPLGCWIDGLVIGVPGIRPEA